MPEHLSEEHWRLIDEIIRRTVAEHVASCPLGHRVQRLEVRVSALVAFMAGAGVLGGGVGAGLARLLMGGTP